jgi:phosphatidylglycerol---prolipoprotein diacylglyceryl transferase
VFAISPHGIGIAIGFLVGAWLLSKLGPRRGLEAEHISSMVAWALLGTLVGARLFYVIAHVSDFDNPIEWFEVWKGGISLLGGIAGATVVNVPKMHRYGYRFFQVMDPAVICLSLGIAIGRIGDLVIGDHLGKPTSWLLAWTYHGGNLSAPFHCAEGACRASLQDGHIDVITRTGARLVDASGTVIAEGVGVHQTALYDMIGAWALFAFLWWLAKRSRREGALTLTFGLWYGSMRLVEDSLRIDKRFFGLTGSQWTALTVATISAVLLLVWGVRSRGYLDAGAEHERGVVDGITDGERETSSLDEDPPPSAPPNRGTS